MVDSNLDTNQITQNLSDETTQLTTTALQTGTTLLSRYVIQDTLGV